MTKIAEMTELETHNLLEKLVRIFTVVLHTHLINTFR